MREAAFGPGTRCVGIAKLPPGVSLKGAVAEAAKLIKD
jgi:hypothetical protein